jgi:8-amino-7-oxononanoate synthase
LFDGAVMLDFTSALYLGFRHPSVSLAPWPALTLGVPAALRDPPDAGELAGELARLTGAEAGLLFPSTLHLFRDLFSAVAGPGSILLMDAKAYPIARWGAEAVQLGGTECEAYPHHDTAALAKRARRAFRAGLRPVVVTDGLCPACGRLAPLPELARIAAECGGHLVVDDTQALGIVGRPAGRTAPLGVGGGGTLAWYGLSAPHVYSGSSLAKAFGAPLAVLAGPASVLGRMANEGATRIHCSPPPAASIAAARAALTMNDTPGDLLRARLSRRIAHLRQGLHRIGARLLSTLPLPMQSIALPAQSARAVLTALQAREMRVLITEGCGQGPVLTVILTAQHANADVDRLIEALASVLHGDNHNNQTGWHRHEQQCRDVRNRSIRR